jgi:hypothetical protein
MTAMGERLQGCQPFLQPGKSDIVLQMQSFEVLKDWNLQVGLDRMSVG